MGEKAAGFHHKQSNWTLQDVLIYNLDRNRFCLETKASVICLINNFEEKERTELMNAKHLIQISIYP